MSFYYRLVFFVVKKIKLTRLYALLEMLMLMLMLLLILMLMLMLVNQPTS